MKRYILISLGFAALGLAACKKDELNTGVTYASYKWPASALPASRTGDPDPSPIDLGNLTKYQFVFTSGSADADWQGASKGYCGDMAANLLIAHERTSGAVPFAGTMFCTQAAPGQWQSILNQNPDQSQVANLADADMSSLMTDLTNSFTRINAMPVTPGFEAVSAQSLEGLNTTDGVAQTTVINITSGFQVFTKIHITGDINDVFILRWDTDADPSNGYQGIVKFQSGGGIIPGGGLTPTNFVNVAGDINASGGGTNPPPPYPQGPRYNDGQGALITGGQDFNGGGFFTGYWLTTGDPSTHNTQPLSNAIFVGGWYTTTIKFSMTSGTSGVHVAPPAVLIH